ncbi:hypothetical protein DWB68_13250 [Galactobacter valiniphilus]|uniref:Uncharacterized protein n=1 Tax=Galactobacter valiniphilus TaxID=2676122 RepID=A0A399J7M2_9MICC|nr:hypothetical protein [Galactobacter valiniphilus]RII41304.1 hypothetical protein DWB68_13250 [Galactobacter valiniphilus]
MRRRWWIMGAGLIVVIVAAVILTVVLNRPENTAGPETSSTGAATTGKYGFPVSPIRVGEGGRELAPDGKTRVGYGPSCQEAAQAALNYYSFGRSAEKPDMDALTKTAPMIYATQDDVTSKLYFVSTVIGEAAPGALQVNVAAPGLFNIAKCTEGQSALVVLAVSSTDTRPSTNIAETRMTAVQVNYVDGTWKETYPDFYEFDTGQEVSQPASEGFVKITPEVINRLFTSDEGKPLSRDGWFEVSNAQ